MQCRARNRHPSRCCSIKSDPPTHLQPPRPRWVATTQRDRGFHANPSHTRKPAVTLYTARDAKRSTCGWALYPSLPGEQSATTCTRRLEDEWPTPMTGAGVAAAIWPTIPATRSHKKNGKRSATGGLPATKVKVG